MNWTNQKPTSPGVYWYHGQHKTHPEDFEMLNIVWDESKHFWVAQTHGRGTISVDACAGEWYGPIVPPMSSSNVAFSPDHPGNTRIAVRLRHGGSFYVENTIPEGMAIVLSEKLKTLHKRGSSIPVPLRAKITGLLRELMRFAKAPPAREQINSAGK